MLKAKTIRLLNEVADHILEEPKRLEMGTWGETFTEDSKYSDDGDPIPSCRTQGCVAGWTIFLNRPRLWKQMLKGATDNGYSCDLNDSTDGSIPGQAIKILGITEEQGASLFYLKDWMVVGDGGGWPQKFTDAYNKAKSKKQKAKVTAARIRHFIKMGGVVEATS